MAANSFFFWAALAFAVVVDSSSSPLFCSAYDLDPLQDFCVAVPDQVSAVFVNGKLCKNPKLVTVDDFLGFGFHLPGKFAAPTGFSVTVGDVNSIPGLNTQGLTLIRVDIEPNGVVPPHTHPRATEVIVLLEGTIYAGFVTSNPPDGSKNRLFAKVLKAGDMFVFPIGMVHFQRNVGKTKAMGIVAFNSQNPGIISVANSVFGTEPHISPELLTKSFQLDNKTIDYLFSKF
ncbi:OLC1v1005507C1 [Oldenlandia corymbosa var. corymbosa]|uniref:Germin-like protein n=1 Tax=Oldenlandia corymbosa var. corymbosa TaxID=529605 RepID=A0AAV1DEV4_OLDCO|nr:OLC1v1005507C1 [Oldenlandia corymbosa var. corymbosa]